MGRMLILAGVALLAAGLFIHFGGRLPLRLGRLPGDIRIQGRNSTFYFPVVTCLLLSVLLSFVVWLFKR